MDYFSPSSDLHLVILSFRFFLSPFLFALTPNTTVLHTLVTKLTQGIFLFVLSRALFPLSLAQGEVYHSLLLASSPCE